MIQQIRIQNFKSIVDLTLDLGRVTVLIGENGAGKSNILEAIAFFSATSNQKLENEFLASRGIRLPDQKQIVSNFEKDQLNQPTYLEITEIELDEKTLRSSSKVSIQYSEAQGKWLIEGGTPMSLTHLKQLKASIEASISTKERYQAKQIADFDWENYLADFERSIQEHNDSSIFDYLIYSPEYRALRIFDEETQIRPLGINGAGLFRLLKKISQENPEALQEIREGLQLLDWFEDLEIPTNLFATERYLNIKDRYIDETMDYFDQRSTNEGFVFLLFYLTLFVSKETPAFFAIDNIDASLNPKLCRRLMSELVKLAKKHDKQVILTTHNPGLLDGLNLHDNEQRLLVVSRNLDGHTKVRRIEDKRNLEQQVRLSEAFLRGYLGGLPKNF